MCSGHCDVCPAPIVVSPLAFRKIADRINNQAQRLEFAIDRRVWPEVEDIARQMSGLLLDIVMCRTSDCACQRKEVP